MIFRYRNYSHDDNEVWFDVEFKTIFSEIGRRQNLLGRWIIYGVKKAASASALTTALEALETAYSVDGGDIQFFDNSSNLTRHFMLNANTVDGVQVEEFKYLPGNGNTWGSGTEYVNMRSYRIILRGMLIPSGILNVVSYRETVIGTGTGGSVFIQKPALQGPPQRQFIQQLSSYQAIQVGEAVGYLGYPVPVGPIWPADEHQERRRIEYGTPRFGAVKNTLFPVRWKYEFESAVVLTGGPTFF